MTIVSKDLLESNEDSAQGNHNKKRLYFSLIIALDRRRGI